MVALGLDKGGEDALICGGGCTQCSVCLSRLACIAESVPTCTTEFQRRLAVALKPEPKNFRVELLGEGQAARGSWVRMGSTWSMDGMVL